MTTTLRPEDALLLVDLQNDFLPGGSLAVPDSDTIIPIVNRYIAAFAANNLPIFASRDYHPADHCSFAEQNGDWPPHCVAGTLGAEFASGITFPETTVIISKATEQHRDAYSALEGTTLEKRLKTAGVKRVFVCGLATDYCVFASARDLTRSGFAVLLLTDAVKAVNLQPQDGDMARKKLRELGVMEITLDDLKQ